jgi:hypothetical protein
MKYIWFNNTLGTRRALTSAAGYLVRELHGFSLPGKDHISARAPQQHGATYVDTFFRPRECALVILVKGCNADDFQFKHRQLVRAMNPLDDCQLRIQTDGGDRYTLTCRPVTAMGVVRHNAISADVLVQLVADDPFFHTPEESEEFTTAMSTGLMIPFVFPGVIAEVLMTGSLTVTNDGHVPIYPTFTINGPCTNPDIINDTTGETLSIAETVAAGDVLTIDMGQRTAIITGAGGAETNVLGSVSGVWWALDIGDNAIRITSDVAVAFTGSIAYTERYLAVV